MSDSKILVGKDKRSYTVRKLTPGQFLDVLEAAGAASQNTGYLNMASTVCSVTHIDGVPLPTPTDQRQIKINADKIGMDGMQVVLQGKSYGEEESSNSDKDVSVDVAKN